MTDVSGEKSPQKLASKVAKKAFSFTWLIVVLAIFGFAYIALINFQKDSKKKESALLEVQKFDNIESNIFDLSEDSEFTKDEYLAEANINDLREKGAEFIYQMLLKHQVKMADLSMQIQEIESELVKYKSQERIGKMILSYVELRQKFLAGKVFDDELKSFEIIAALEVNLQEAVKKLKIILPKFSKKEDLKNSFSALIPALITAKNIDPNQSLLSKIRSNISKLVIVRKINGKDEGKIDSRIVQIEQFLHDEKYQEAMNLLLGLDQNYHDIVADFLSDLNIAIELQNLDTEILNYLKSLT